MGGLPLAVADDAAVAGDPGKGTLDDSPAGQDFEGAQVIAELDDNQRQLSV